MTTTDDENWGRTMFTHNQEKIHDTILGFMEEKDQGGGLAFSPEYMLGQLKPSFKTQGLRVGTYTLQQVLSKSNAITYDFEVTGTAYRNPIAKVEYKFEPKDENNVVISTIGGQPIEAGEDVVDNVYLTSRFKLPINVRYYDELVDWKLTISEIKLLDGTVLELDNFSEQGIEVTDNKTIIVRDKPIVARDLNTSPK